MGVNEELFRAGEKKVHVGEWEKKH